jgi:uncharacterized membrane protein required for colicin V production
MFATTTAHAASSFNWFDVVVLIGLGYGAWSGIRTGLTGELIRGIGWILTVVLALHFYQPLGLWLSDKISVTREFGHLVAFISITFIMYLIQLAIRSAVHKRVKRFKFGVVLENVGGFIAGLVRMLLVMTFLSVMLCLMRSPFWHQQVGINSAFGSYVASQFPAVEEMVYKRFPEKLWFSEDLKRPDDPGIDDIPKKR